MGRSNWKNFPNKSRHCTVTMITVNIGRKTNILTMMHGCRKANNKVNSALTGLRLRNYVELRVQLHTTGKV